MLPITPGTHVFSGSRETRTRKRQCRHLCSKQAPHPAGWLPMGRHGIEPPRRPPHCYRANWFTANREETDPASSGGRNRTCELLVQSQASLPTATAPEKRLETGDLRLQEKTRARKSRFRSPDSLLCRLSPPTIALLLPFNTSPSVTAASTLSLMRDHRKLRAFELADQLALAVYQHTSAFPRSEMFGLSSQMRRAAVSVASNIVEGCARDSSADYLRFLDMAYGSARELEYQLSLARRLGYLSESSHVALG